MVTDEKTKPELPEPSTSEVSSDDLLVSRAIVRLAETGSFSAAARTLGVSVSAITRALQRHEQRLGVALFLRSTHGVTPTVAGRRYAEHLTRWLIEEDGMRAALNAEKRAETGSLRITVPVFVAQELMLDALRAFRCTHPGVSVEVHASDDIRDLIKEGYDLAIRMGPLAPSNLRTRAVGSFRRWLVAAPSFLKQHSMPEDPQALRTLPCLMYGQDQKWDFFTRDGQHCDVVVNGKLRSNNLELLRRMCCAGHGIARLPDGVVIGDIRSGELIRLLADFTCSPRDTRPTMYAVHARDPGKDRVRDAFIRTLQETASARLSAFEGP